MNETIVQLEVYQMEDIQKLVGVKNVHLSLLEDAFDVQVILQDDCIRILGEQSEKAAHIIKAILPYIADRKHFDERDMLYLISLQKADRLYEFSRLKEHAVGRTFNGKPIFPKTIGQQILCRHMEQDDIVFASGVAGTGKTYLAVVYAVNKLKKGDVEKIILTRPAVEAGENLGFLPGDLKEKVDPYLRPLYDALYDTLGSETTERYVEKGTIEIAPLAYMRGRTLDKAFIILDEAQNTTRSQMKMFLTRMGFESKIVITGDVSQIDLIKKKDSGLVEAKHILEGIEGIGFVELTSLDVVRHPLVQKIIESYSKEEEKNA